MNKPIAPDLSLKLFFAIWLLIAVTSLYTAGNLPPDLTLPIHWDMQFQPDGYASKWFALLMLPVLSIALTGLFYVLPMLEPRRENMQKSAEALRHIFWAVQILLCILQAFLINVAWEWHLPMAKFVAFGMGLVFIIIGNILAKTRSTYLLGIRTPWTLNNDRIWRTVHTAAGKQLFAVGLLLLISLPWAGTWTLLIGLISMGCVFAWAMIYSYLLWRKSEKTVVTEE